MVRHWYRCGMQVFVTNVSTTAAYNDTDRPTEIVSLRYRKIAHTYRMQGPDGRLVGDGDCTCFDVGQNEKCGCNSSVGGVRPTPGR